MKISVCQVGSKVAAIESSLLACRLTADRKDRLLTIL